MISIKNNNTQKLIVSIISLIIFGFLFFTFKINSIPPGLETDEGSIAYNSVLISQNLRDQNHRFLPVFILSSDRIDWKQPVLIYFTAALFKIFGSSLFIYKLANVIFSLLGASLLAVIVNILFKNKKYSFSGFLIYITTPIIFIATRIGNESLLPSFISTLWLLTLLLYKRKPKLIYLVFNALSLGIGFYSFKGMRAITPTWSVISFIFIYALNWNKKYPLKKNIFNPGTIKKVLLFSTVLLPFYLISPILELKYAGAVFDRRSFQLHSIYDFFYYWLSNLSLSFWFATPDVGRVYHIASFGAVFLIFMPIFITGLISSIYKKNDFTFISICFLLTPLLFGVARSINYSHRLTAAVPFIIILILSGFKNTFIFLKKIKYRSLIYLGFFLLLTISIFDFYKFYFINYPKLNTTKEAFGKYTFPSFLKLSKLSQDQNLTPYVQENIFSSEGDEHKFYNLVYFKNKLNIWNLGENIPNKSILLTENDSLEGFSNPGFSPGDNLHILIKNE